MGSRINAAGDEAVRKRTSKALPALLDHVDALLAEGVIGGAEPNAADFQIAPSVRLMMLFDDLEPAIEGRPAAEHATRTLPALRRPHASEPPTGVADSAAKHALAVATGDQRLVSGVPSDARRSVRRHATWKPPPPYASPTSAPRATTWPSTASSSRTRPRRASCANARRRGPTRRATITDAIEIGARVLDREQTGANADFVKSEFEKVSKEVEREFGDNAREVAEQLGRKVDEVFHPESGHLAKSLEELFSDGSSRAVQNRVKEIVGEAMQRSREDLLRQFSSGGDKNPLADFKTGTMNLIKAADERQHNTQRALLAQMARAGEAASGPARREGQAGAARRRTRARHREGPHLRGAGGRGPRRDRRRAKATAATPSATWRGRRAARATR